MGAYSRGTGSNPVEGNGHFFSLMPSALSFVKAAIRAFPRKELCIRAFERPRVPGRVVPCAYSTQLGSSLLQGSFYIPNPLTFTDKGRRTDHESWTWWKAQRIPAGNRTRVLSIGRKKKNWPLRLRLHVSRYPDVWISGCQRSGYLRSVYMYTCRIETFNKFSAFPRVQTSGCIAAYSRCVEEIRKCFFFRQVASLQTLFHFFLSFCWCLLAQLDIKVKVLFGKFSYRP